MLFQNTTQFNQFADSANSIDFASISPSIAHAERRYLLPLLGQNFYSNLEAKFQANALTGLEVPLVAKLQTALASLALYLYVPISEAMITDNGVRRAGGNEQSAPGAYKYQVQDLRRALLERGYEALEDAMNFLNANAASFTLWTNSAEYRSYRSLFIQSGNEFAELYSGVRFPRLIYLQLRSTMLALQELSFAPAILQANYDALVAVMVAPAPSPTTQQSQLLTYLKRAQAHLAVARGLGAVAATMDDLGLHVLAGSVDASSSSSKRASAPATLLSVLLEEAESAGQAWLDKAIAYMNSVATDSVFPSWFNKMQEDTGALPNNATFGGMFAM